MTSATPSTPPTLVVVGIGADGWDGLTPRAQAALRDAEVLFGSPRQLDLVPLDTEKVLWPTPLLPALDATLAAHEGKRRVVVASGDPMHFGIGATLADRHELEVIPAVSSIALACARMGWAQQDVAVVSLVGRPLASLVPALHDGARVLVLSPDASTPAQVADLFAQQGFSASTITVLSQLGGPEERVGGEPDDLNVVALECRGTGHPVVPGLPDEAFENDGQITKREVRAVLLSLLAPRPRQLLWDVGAGTGSVGIEWARAGGRTLAIEKTQEKCERVARNAAQLGAQVTVVSGEAPDALAGLDAPHAVFVGGGVTTPGLVAACWSALQPGGRFVANAVTVESEVVLLAMQQKHGGDLLRMSVQRTAPVGSFTGWKPMTTLTVWSVTR